MVNSIDTPFQLTFVAQGTVAEDATAGTHLCSLTVSPGAGNEMQLLYGKFVAGAGAANLCNIVIRDAVGGNTLTSLIPDGLSLASGAAVSFPGTGAIAAGQNAGAASPFIVSGLMAFVMTVSTATVSLTHTFSACFRIRDVPPTTVALADTVGTPTLTLNTNRVF